MNRIMQFVLYSGEEHLCHIVTWVIIRSRSINIGDLLIEVTFATANVPDTLQKLTEIPITALLQSLVIHSESLLDIFVKPLGCPATETSSHLRLDTIPQSDDHVKVVVQNTALHLTFTLLPNCQEILYS